MPPSESEVSPALGLLSHNHSSRPTISYKEDHVALKHQAMRMRLPKGSRLEEQRDKEGKFIQVFYDKTPNEGLDLFSEPTNELDTPSMQAMNLA